MAFLTIFSNHEREKDEILKEMHRQCNLISRI